MSVDDFKKIRSLLGSQDTKNIILGCTLLLSDPSISNEWICMTREGYAGKHWRRLSKLCLEILETIEKELPLVSDNYSSVAKLCDIGAVGFYINNQFKWCHPSFGWVYKYVNDQIGDNNLNNNIFGCLI